MGDIKSKPKAPSPQVIYVPQPVYTPPASGQNPGNSGGQGDGEEKSPSKIREQNLLSRSRSRLGTVLTGFRGILAPAEAGAQRKTLLGE